PKQDKPLIDPLVFRNKLLIDYPNADIEYVELETQHGKAIKVYLDSKKDAGYAQLKNDELYANPYTGEIIGSRLWGDIGQGWTNLMPFIFRLHYSLALKGVGILMFGVIALLWTLDCFIGAYLTFPLTRKEDASRRCSQKISNWKNRWSNSWTIRWRAGFY